MASHYLTSETTITSSPQYPQEKGLAVDLDSSSHDQRTPSRCCYKRYALLALCYVQVALLGCAEAIVSVVLAGNGCSARTSTWPGLWKSLNSMSTSRNCLLAAFTIFDVITLYVISSEAQRLEGNETVRARASSKKWVMILQMVLLMAWVHGGAAWAMLRGPFVSTFGKGPNTVDWGFDVVLPLSLTFTFFVTFVLIMERYCRTFDGERVGEWCEEEGAEYEITL